MQARILALPLAVRIFLGAAVLIIPIAAISAYFVVKNATQVYLVDRGAASGNRAERSAQRIVESIDALRRDTVFLSRVPPVTGILQATVNRGVDTEEGTPLESWYLRLQEIFSALAEARPQYFQLRLIGLADNGRELVRVAVVDGRVVVTPPGQLQSKGDRDYFQSTLKLKQGEIHLSEVNLNREPGGVQVPYIRTLRAATPIFTPGGDLFGMLVVNMDVGKLIDFATTNLPPGIHAYVANSAGDYLAHPESGRTFGFDLGRRYTWQQEMPALPVPLVAGHAGQRPLQAISTPDGVLHVAVERISFDPQNPDRFLLLIYALPDAFVAARLAGLRITILRVTVILVLVLGAVMFLLLRQAFAPLIRLTAVAGKIGSGDYDVDLPEQAPGEMGVFVRAFRTMQERVRHREKENWDSNAALQKSEARLHTVVENLAEGIVAADLDGRLLHFNRAAVEMHGFTRPDEYLRLVTEFVDTFELSAADGTVWPVEQWPLARILRGEILRDLEVRIRRPRTDWQRIFSYGGALARAADGQPLLAVVTMRDITGTRLVEQAARENQERYRTLFNTLIEGFCIVEVLFDSENRPIDYRFLEVNSAFEAQTGLQNAQGKRMREFAPDHEEHWFAIYGKVALTGESVRFVNEAKALDRWYDVSAYRVGGSESRKVAILFNDITKIKRAEVRIREQLERLGLLDHITRAIGERQDLKSIFQVVVRSLEDSLPIDFGCVCQYDSAGNALRVTSIGVKSAGLARELLLAEQAWIDVDDNGLGRCVRGELVYEPDIQASRFPFPARLARAGLGSMVLAPLRAESRVFGVLVAARGKTQGFSSVECEFLRQLSQHVALAAHHAQLYDALQQAYDDLRQTQQVVMQEERLRALGQMASGIAHDINNALSPVSLYTESMLETEKNLSDRARGYLETIQRAVQDVAQTVARMREFYRQREQQLELARVDVNQMVQQVLDLTKARWSDLPMQSGIVIRALAELAPGLPAIMGVESEIREALTNLVFNAVDAMPEGGTLTLRTRQAGVKPAQSVIVEVVDTGIGMDEETRRRCLEPFFTTKGERGTGLGLAMVFGMAQRHSADLQIDSVHGVSTTMRLEFAVPTAALVEPGRPSVLLEIPSRLRLLLVDDDPVLLNSLRNALETDGHVIVTANGGEAGIAAFRAAIARGEPFAAVISDLGMPYVDGRKVAAAVKETSSGTPVILLTGWGQRLMSEGDIPLHVDRVLAKPPRLRELRAALAQLCRGQS